MEAPRISDEQHPDPIVLRPIAPADIDAILDLGSDPQMQRWTTVPAPYARGDAEAFVSRCAVGWADGSSLTLAIESLDDLSVARFAGNVSLRPDGAGAASIGFALAPWARGRGVMSRAVRLVLEWGFATLDLQVVHWQAHEGNWGSRRVARACGFRVEGLVRGLLSARGVRYDGWIGSVVRGEALSPTAAWLGVPDLVGKRVVLRPWRENDVPRVAEACADVRTQAWLPQLPSPYTVSDAQWYVRSREEQHASARGLYWCVADADDDRCLGSIAVFGLAGPDPAPEIGYWTHPAERGRGVMTEAVRMVVRHAVIPAQDGGLGLPRVTVRAASRNTASNAVAVAAGFTRTGVLRQGERLRDGTVDDFVLYDVLAAEVADHA